jgi:hypothetical protein
MSFQSDLDALLRVAAVTSIVGEDIFPGIAPQGTEEPYIVWRRNGGDPLSTMGGAVRDRRFINVLIYCVTEGDNYDQACELADAVHDAVHAGSSAMKGTCNPPVDGFLPETRTFSVIVEARLFHRS